MSDNLIPEYLLGLGDDALVYTQRLGEWVSRAPAIEEDMAFGNIALDLLGQARSLLTYAGQVDGTGRSEDDLAYLRDEREFRSVHLVQAERGDFAVEMARLLWFSATRLAVMQRLTRSTDDTLRGVAEKAVKELAYHRDYAGRWFLVLAQGTDESRRRLLAALYNAGYYGPEISIQAAGREVADLTLAADLPKNVPMTITVRPGPPFLFGRADIVNAPPPQPTADDDVPTPASIGYASGKPAPATIIDQASALSVRQWRELARAKAKEADRTVVANCPPLPCSPVSRLRSFVVAMPMPSPRNVSRSGSGRLSGLAGHVRAPRTRNVRGPRGGVPMRGLRLRRLREPGRR